MNRFPVAVLAVVVTITVAGCGGIVKINSDASTGPSTSTSPTVASISPNRGDVAGGTSLSITGTNFRAGARVLFGTTSASNVTVNSATQIQVVTPPRTAGLVDVTVRNTDGQSGMMPSAFTYTATPASPPSISSISPNSATPGTPVTINGANFVSGATVSFGGSAASVTFLSSTQLKATVPSLSPGVVDVKVTNPGGSSATLPGGFTVLAAGDHTGTKHYFYNIPWTLPITVEVYDMDSDFALVRSFVPDPNASDYAKGIVVSANGPTRGMLYISYGCYADLSSCAGGHGGHLLAYNLNGPQPHLVWNREYPFGIDSFSITPDGLRIYMPTGENSTDTHWQIIDAITGNRLCDTCAIDTGQRGPHNTIVSNDGTRVYLGAADNSDPLFSRNAFYLIEADPATNQIIHPTIVPQGVGPVGQSVYGDVKSVRPFTIGFFGPQRKQYALINDQTRIGFNVGDIDSGEIRFRVGTAINPAGDPGGEYSHGITLSPDSKAAYVVDADHNLIHVYDVRGISENIEPSEIGTYSVSCSFGEPPDNPCLHWLLASRDGHYIFVANTNNVIDAWSLNVITTPGMAIGDKFTEVTVTDGVVTFAPLSRSGVGY